MRRLMITAVAFAAAAALAACQKGDAGHSDTPAVGPTGADATAGAPVNPDTSTAPGETTGAAGATTGAVDPNANGAGAMTGSNPNATTGSMGSTNPGPVNPTPPPPR